VRWATHSTAKNWGKSLPKKKEGKKRREGFKKKKRGKNVCPKKQKRGAPTIDIY